jgi:hypothetical protein
MECMPHGLLLFGSISHLTHGCMCPLLGYKPHILSFFLVSPLLASDYDSLGQQDEGELPDGTPLMVSSE